MSWIRRLHRRFDLPPVTDEELARDREVAEERAEKTEAIGEEVRKVAARLRRQRAENHFGPLVWAALRGESDV